MSKLVCLITDLVVIAAAANFIFFTYPDDSWHKFAYYVAGMSFGWYCTIRYRETRGKGGYKNE